MKRIFSISVLLTSLLLLFLVTGCANTKPTPPAQPNQGSTNPQTKPQPKPETPIPAGQESTAKPADYFPLIKGAVWEYQGEGNEYASFSRKVLFTKDNLAQVQEDNGGTSSAAIYKTTDQEITRIFFKGEEYDQTNFLNSPSNDQLVILKKPFKVGTAWTEKYATREIVDLNASVVTPLGTLTKCLKVKVSQENSTVYEYFQVGTGMVKREFISGEAKVTSTLKKYTKP